MKKLALLLAVILLVGIFAGCQSGEAQDAASQERSIENANGTLSDWMKKEIEKAWKRDVTWYEESKATGTRYLGNENGYVFLFSQGYTAMAMNKVIGAYKFKYPMGFSLLAYKDGETYQVEDLYKEGILSDECIKMIHDNFYMVPTKPGLDEYK